jgi:hypothetical protein
MPSPGHFVLHSRAVPPLSAGDYTLHGQQTVAGGPTAPYDGHLRITSPRYRMPPDQILSTFPPANAEGAFESRLPQVVLRRRTLPWERTVDADRTIPWLALVVIAEGEGQLSGEVPIAECVTPGVSLTGPNDVATGSYLAVSQTVVNNVFPTKEDLELLVHVREVDLNDTELAMGDDDGFLAVILANRLPQYDQQNCKPVRYLACLINLEGQLSALPPPPANIVGTFEVVAAVQDLSVFATALSAPKVPDHIIMGTGVAPAPAIPALGGPAGGRPALPAAAVAGASLGSNKSAKASQWSFTPKQVEEATISAAPEEAWRVARDVMRAGWRYDVEHLVPEKVYRFPVLAQWSFTSMGAGSFETLMQGLDVGLLGTIPSDPSARPAPDCVPPAKGDAPPPTPPSRPDLESTETGHVGLNYLTRRGENVRAWYRGPLTLHVTERDTPDEEGRLPLAHTSDQLRRLVPDGREDLSLAAAFEIGRLIALSQPYVVASLMQWRQERFGESRAGKLSGIATADVPSLSVEATMQELGRLVGKQFLLEAAKDPGKVLGPSRPLADPGRPLTYAVGDLDAIIATGFGIDLAKVRELSNSVGAAGALGSVAVPQRPAGAFDGPSADRLRAALSDAVGAMTADVVKAGVIGRPGLARRARGPDALDALIEAATPKGEDRS